ncbi:MAG: chromosome partitioning protein [bacterium]|jgi:chromosome partitioning protein
MPRIIAISNQKGGVGKTTTCINLAASLALLKKKVLILDLDPQGNTTSGLGIPPEQCETNMYHALIDGTSLDEIIRPTILKKLFIAPSNVDLSGAEIGLVGMIAREMKLKLLLQKMAAQFDYIFIDCPPSLGLLTINALTAAKSVLVPLQCEYYALEGMSQLMRTVDLIRDSLNPELKIEGILPTMFDSRNNISKQVLEDVKEHFSEILFQTHIPRNVRLSEAPSFGKPVFLYDKHCSGALSYIKLAREILQKHKKEATA